MSKEGKKPKFALRRMGALAWQNAGRPLAEKGRKEAFNTK